MIVICEPLFSELRLIWPGSSLERVMWNVHSVKCSLLWTKLICCDYKLQYVYTYQSCFLDCQNAHSGFKFLFTWLFVNLLPLLVTKSFLLDSILLPSPLRLMWNLSLLATVSGLIPIGYCLSAQIAMGVIWFLPGLGNNDLPEFAVVGFLPPEGSSDSGFGIIIFMCCCLFFPRFSNRLCHVFQK